MKRLTSVDFIERARKTHGDEYIYDKSTYKTAKAKITITCRLHGDFDQQAFSHLSGSGCPKCSGKNKTNEEFIANAKDIHNDTYDYSKTEYINSEKKIIVICKEHGE